MVSTNTNMVTNEQDFIFDSIFPVIYYDRNNKVNIVGTSTLVEHNDQIFLITAAHVLRDPISKQYPIFILVNNKAILLSEPAIMSKEPSQKNGYELDIAFFPLFLYPNIMRHLNAVSKTITLRDYNENISYEREHYFVFGYPWRKAKYDKDNNELKAKPLEYFTDKTTDNKLFAKYNRSKKDHIIVKYKPKSTKNSNGKKVQAPFPHGASGGALFRALVDKDDSLIMIILEGILIEWKDSQYIIATRKSATRNFIDGKQST